MKTISKVLLILVLTGTFLFLSHSFLLKQKEIKLEENNFCQPKSLEKQDLEKNIISIISFSNESISLLSDKNIYLSDKFLIRKKGTKRIFFLTGELKAGVVSNIKLPNGFISKNKNDLELIKLEVIDAKRDYP